MTDNSTTESETREVATQISLRFASFNDPVCDRMIAVIDEALRNERERCAKIAEKQAVTLRRAAHVVQQPTEEALRMAELAINQCDQIAAAIRRDGYGRREKRVNG